jgi:CRISPR/Cas system CSM-associated protein Csm2 small subunit
MKTVNTGTVPASPYTTETPTNTTELRNDLSKLYAEIRNGQIKLDMAKEATNAAGKILKSVAVQIAYAEMRKEKTEIPFAK